jgi:hypothetical protein
MYFSMSVSAPYLEATVTAATVVREHAHLEVFVNISQMTVSQMGLTEMMDSPQQRQHWLAEQVLNWSGLPVVHVRPTVFLQNPFFLAWAAESIAEDGTIRLPFGSGRISPVDARDAAEVVAAVLARPTGHIGKVYELTGRCLRTCMHWPRACLPPSLSHCGPACPGAMRSWLAGCPENHRQHPLNRWGTAGHGIGHLKASFALELPSGKPSTRSGE